MTHHYDASLWLITILKVAKESNCRSASRRTDYYQKDGSIEATISTFAHIAFEKERNIQWWHVYHVPKQWRTRLGQSTKQLTSFFLSLFLCCCCRPLPPLLLPPSPSLSLSLSCLCFCISPPFSFAPVIIIKPEPETTQKRVNWVSFNFNLYFNPGFT